MSRLVLLDKTWQMHGRTHPWATHRLKSQTQVVEVAPFSLIREASNVSAVHPELSKSFLYRMVEGFLLHNIQETLQPRPRRRRLKVVGFHSGFALNDLECGRQRV